MLTVLTIAGFDPSAGAGALADIKTIAAFGCYGVAAISSVTHQNTLGVFGAQRLSARAVRDQLDPILDDFSVAAAKTGMLPTAEVINAVADALSTRNIPHIVVDPVIRSTSGYDLIDDDARQALIEKLFPLASVVTPNRLEAELLSGVAVKDRESMLKAARIIFDSGAKAVLVKGGDLEGQSSEDALIDTDGERFYCAERVHSTSTHGTGCALSSALACLLAQGRPLEEAIPEAKRYIVESICSAPQLGHGRGPLDHFPRVAALHKIKS
jgi:hydroxymethylpyrimidine kinase/phosphomethylpyrimidine kinase